MTYNGWTNYQTWNVPLWIDNEEATYRLRLEVLGPFPTASGVERFVREIFPRGTPDFKDGAADYENVNWTEIAANWTDE